MKRLAGLAAALAFALACHPAEPPRPPSVARTTVEPAGELVAAVERDGALYLFARDRVTIEQAGRIAATVRAPEGPHGDPGEWRQAVEMPALDDAGPDGSASWIVARTTAGELWRITAAGDLEPIDARLGLASPAHALAASATTAGIAADRAVGVIRDRAHIAWVPLDAPAAALALSASHDRLALRRGDALAIWRLADLREVDYAVPGALAAAFIEASGHSRLVVATRDALYSETDDAAGLHRIAAPAPLHQLAVAGAHAWLTTDTSVLVLDGDRLADTRVAATAADHLFGLASGDALLASPGQLARLSIDDALGAAGAPAAASADAAQWRTTVKPIVDRICARCHRPGGTSRVDLTTFTAWRSERRELVHRVVDTRTMPPAGSKIDDADRRALAGWLLQPH